MPQGRMPIALPGIDVYENNRANCGFVRRGICFQHVGFAGSRARWLSSVAALRSRKFVWRKSPFATGWFRSRLSPLLCNSRRLPCIRSITPRVRSRVLQQHELCVRRFATSISLPRPSFSILCRSASFRRAVLLELPESLLWLKLLKPPKRHQDRRSPPAPRCHFCLLLIAVESAQYSDSSLAHPSLSEQRVLGIARYYCVFSP